MPRVVPQQPMTPSTELLDRAVRMIVEGVRGILVRLESPSMTQEEIAKIIAGADPFLLSAPGSTIDLFIFGRSSFNDSDPDWILG